MLSDIFYKKPLYKPFLICYNIQQHKRKEMMTMKITYTEPVDIDELIFAGEVTVPSDR